MMQKLLRVLPVVGLAIAGQLWTSDITFAENDGSRYEVTVTNITRGQAFTPALVVTHDKDFTPLFTEGAPASPGLALIAEDGDIRDLATQLKTDPHVGEVTSIQGTFPLPLPPTGPGGFVFKPGQSASVTVRINSNKKWISLVGMLASTNDAFYAVNKVAVPSGNNDVATYYSVAWDAGSEVNNENCMVLPGPPCGHFFVRDTAGAEGYVHVHPGIQGVGDLTPALHDWRNPVAKITIRRVSDR